jgi:SAM-dependent methyltransferase
MALKQRFKRAVRRLIGDPAVRLEEMPNCPYLFHFYRDLIATGHKRVQGGWEFNGHYYPDFLTVGGAIYFIRKKAQEHCRGKGLDIGAGAWPFPGSTAIDTLYGPDSTKLSDIPDNSCDYVFSSHTLEHIKDWDQALTEWISKIRPGGTLFIYLPHPDCWLWRKENPFMAQYHEWVPTPSVVKEAIERHGCRIVDHDDGPDVMYGFYVAAILN